MSETPVHVMTWRPMTDAEKERECARIRDVRRWPHFPVLHMKRLRGRVIHATKTYEAFGFIRARETDAGDNFEAVPTVRDPDTATTYAYVSVEAMVDAGWIGD